MIEPEELQVLMPWGKLALKTWNSSNLEPILVIHGAGDNAGSFDALIPLLSNQYYYVCVDLPGHGFSDGFTKGLPISFMHHVATLQRLIRHFAWPNFSIMGHSFGAQLSLVLASAEHKKVNKLILLDGTVRYFIQDDTYLERCTSELEEVLEIEENSENKVQLTSYDEAVKKCMNGVFGLTKEASKALLKRTLIKTSKGYYNTADPRTCFRNMPHMSEKTHLYNCSILDFPILIIYPKESKLWEIYQASEFHQNISNMLLKSHNLSRIEYVSGNHSVHSNAAPVVSPIINNFLSDTADINIVYNNSKL